MTRAVLLLVIAGLLALGAASCVERAASFVKSAAVSLLGAR